MLLAFYAVDNSQHYGRHEFDCIYDKPSEIKKMLSKLSDEELRIYDTGSEGLYDLAEDYNDEIIDGSQWWCVVIP